MKKNARSHIDDLRGASRLAVEATRGIAALVEKMHVTIASGPTVLGQPLAGPVRLVTGAVYASIDGIAKLVGAGLDAALAQLAPLVEASEPGPQREALQSAVNGVLGDYLHATENPLAIEMELRRPAETTPRLAVLVHGSSMTDAQFTRGGHDHGAALARDLGYTPVYLRYNSGLHVSTNGRAFAAKLEELVASWPVDVAELVLIGHSMGGLVARSACHVAIADGRTWPAKLRALITLGTPHHGAPLERGGNWFEQLLDLSPYSAPLGLLGRIRSAGVTDLRFGNVLDEHWQGRDRFERGTDTRTPCALPAGVRCYAIAATLSAEDGPRLRGDGLVPVDSALGRHARPELCLAFPEAHTRIVFATGHLGLLDAPVYATLHAWLAS
jgi:pimeloyl-ACP methyl ester carboxylesterase